MVDVKIVVVELKGQGAAAATPLETVLINLKHIKLELRASKISCLDTFFITGAAHGRCRRAASFAKAH
jgi:hypothetical protein